MMNLFLSKILKDLSHALSADESIKLRPINAPLFSLKFIREASLLFDTPINKFIWFWFLCLVTKSSMSQN